MADVFISYHVSDSTSIFVRNFANKLENMGISCWYAPRNTKPGAFVPSILEAINQCEIFLMIWDEGSNAPGYVFNEMVYAFNLYKKEGRPVIMPFKIGDFQTFPDMGFYLIPFHIFNGGSSLESANTSELIAKIIDILGEKSSEKVIKSGEYGENITYTLYENGILTVSGNGSTNSYEPFAPICRPWEDERLMITKICIEEGVISIGDRAFEYCLNLDNVIIPNSITKIGMQAFAGCPNLTNVIIPDNVTSIGYIAFWNCSNLKNVSVPMNAAIDKYAFPLTAHITHRPTPK